MHFFSPLVLVPALTLLLSVHAISFNKTIPQGSRTRTIQRNGATITIFEHEETGSRLEYVANSGLCETTPGVKQYSGYLSVGDNMNMWFWFFEARKNPETAPLAAWFNGGPGCSSMIGLFQEHGPCTFNNGETAAGPSRNPYSWNEYANMLYIDQPIGVGFSYGANNVDSTATAAPLVWNLLQAFYAKFPEYQNHEFGIFTESYGGHYGPGFAKHIQNQNSGIERGSVKGTKLKLVALGLNNAWINPYDAYKSMIDFALNNTHKRLINQAQADRYTAALNNQCVPALANCNSTNSNQACNRAVMACKTAVENPLSGSGNFDVYDVRAPRNNKFPPSTYINWLRSQPVVSAIGAKTRYNECPNTTMRKFTSTGDDSRSYLKELTAIVNSGVNVLVWAGDADWICNWYGNLYTANDIKYPGQAEFKSKPMAPYTINGKEKGQFKTVRNLSFLRVYGAGHTIPSYQPDVSLQAFVQTMKKQALSST